MMDFDFEKFHFFDVSRSQISQISKFPGRASSILLQYFSCHRYVLIHLLLCEAGLWVACYAQRPSNKEWKADQQAKADEKAAAAADQSKMAAVDKVVSMLEDLQLQVLSGAT